MPLWVRYTDAISKKPLFNDKASINIVKYFENNFNLINKSSKIVKEITFKSIISREIIINNYLNNILINSKNYTIINLAAGLDCRYLMFEGRFKKWYDVDYESTINLKKDICLKIDNYELISADMFNLDWAKNIEKENIIVICEGALMYYKKERVVEYLNKLFSLFSNSHFILEFIGKYGVNYLHPMFKKMNINLPYQSSLTKGDGIELLNAKLVKVECVLENNLVNWFYLNKLVSLFGLKKENILSSIYLFENEN